MISRGAIRVFVSSPSDVRPERLIAERVVRRLAREFAYRFDVEPVMWERQPLLASHHFQDLIVPPHETDIVLVILWSRLGVALPGDRYKGTLSGREVTGTEWEFEDALAGFRERQLPELLLYRKTARVTVELDDDKEIEERQRQRKLVADFMRRWTRDAEGKAFTAASWPFQDGAEFEAMVEDHLRALLHKRAAATAGGGEHAPTVRWHQGSPFRGLQTFEPEHEQIFFGRTRARNELRELLGRRALRGEAFVLVMGASGSGKSSLVKAGLLPDLRLPGMMPRVGLVRDATVRPGAGPDPVDALAAALCGPGALPELLADPLNYDVARLATLLRDAPDQAAHALRQGLTAAGQAAGLTSAGEARLLLIVDQLEELFTVESIGMPERGRYVGALRALARSGVAWVVATMRSDFFARLDGLPELARLASGEATYLVTPPDAGELGQIVRQPAREAGLTFEVEAKTGKSLDDMILTASGGAGSLPLLEYLLDQLFARRTGTGMLTLDAYRALGGLEGAIGARAEEVLATQPPDVQAALPALLRALVTVGQGVDASPTARYAALDRFAPGSTSRRLVDALLAPDARLLVADGDTIRVAHEALLTHWERARRQIAEDRLDLQLRARLEQAAALWRAAHEALLAHRERARRRIAEDRVILQLRARLERALSLWRARALRKGRDSLLLTEGLPLSQAEDLLRRRRDELEPALVDFIQTSAKVARRRRRRGVRRLIYVSTSLAVLVLFASFGLWKSEQGLRQALDMTDALIEEVGDTTLTVDQTKRLMGIVEGALDNISVIGGRERVVGTRTRLWISVVDNFLANDDTDTAEKYATDGLANTKRLVAENADSPIYVSWLSLAWGNVGRVRRARNDTEGAIEAWKEARDVADGGHPDAVRLFGPDFFLRSAAEAEAALADIYKEDGQFEEAETAFNHAVELRKRIVALTEGKDRRDHWSASQAFRRRGEWRRDMDESAEALADFEAALVAQQKWLEDKPSSGQLGLVMDTALEAAKIACDLDDGLDRCFELLETARSLGMRKDREGKTAAGEETLKEIDDLREAARAKRAQK